VGLVGGVEEDVPGAVALDGEVLVVVHGSPVAAGEGTQHDGRGGHVDAQRRQGVADGHVAEEEARAHGASSLR
jgi:hypothetical protein